MRVVVTVVDGATSDLIMPRDRGGSKVTWIGRKRLAFIPLFRTSAPADVIPPDWEAQILQRAVFDPDPATGVDRSLRTYIHTVSSGRADFDAIVMPRSSTAEQNVPVDFLESTMGPQLRSQGFDAAALVMLGGPGAGTAELGGFWSRFVMVEAVGVWAMEFMHCLTGFWDLYLFGGNMGAFDEMACSCGTHPSAYTKAAIGWLDTSAISVQTVHTAGHALYSVGLLQPPPSGRVAAIQIGSAAPYLMVEARNRVDQFDAQVPSEGVIMYRVQTPLPLGAWQDGNAPVELLTTTALQPGQSFTAPNGAVVTVEDAIVGGYTVSVTVPVDTRCSELQKEIAQLTRAIEQETDFDVKKRMLQTRGQLQIEAQGLGCP